MKLVDILARELKVWPEGVDALGQACDGTLHLNKKHDACCGHTETSYSLASDWLSGDDVTRAQWQAAVDALAAQSSESAKDMHDTAVNAQDRDGITMHSDESHPIMDHIAELELLKGMASGNQYRCNVKGIDPGYQEPFKPEWTGEGLPPVGTEFESKSGKGWCECIAVAHDGGFVVFRRYFKGSEYGLYGHCHAGSDQMRPIRSAEQIAAEERKLGIEEMSAHGIDAGDSTIEYTCAALWDAGYRKQ